ncbi:sperm-associated antigen 4 protein isoform X7 [Peromyscus californicus insignis]|uniref:sperm-associated antigen 4 protein isoform X7 n=1 Tax=Peromyscus californicus insignis TaxID=564181 RepID=UPI0022A7F16B|nr:sperm-associated antigen 4 protein isoform X7 [Peromyscus californicus insignis]
MGRPPVARQPTGWISGRLGGAAQLSPRPGSEAGDAYPAGVEELPELPLSGAERVVIGGRRRAGQCLQGGLFHPLPVHYCVASECLSGSDPCLASHRPSAAPAATPAPLVSSLSPYTRGCPSLSPALWWGLLYLVPPLENEPKEMLTLSQYHQRVHSQGQQLQRLQAELNKLHKEVSSVRAAHSERVAKLVFQRLNEDFVRKPDYALSSVGASIDLEKTSSDYEDTNTAYFWNRLSFWNYARPPSVILEPDVFPGNCWAFEGDKGQVVIRLPGHVQLSDITLQHPPPTVAHTGGASSAPRDFAVFGLQVDDETEVLLGKFIFDVQKSEIQTFHLQNDPPSAFPKVKIQILSNWGHPRFTCLYRVRAHGVRISEWAEDNATGVTGGPH